MSKNSQKNMSEINLGNETYHRGFNDGLNGRPKTIKKSHRHVHRYHIGYKAGERERTTVQTSALEQEVKNIRNVAYQAKHLDMSNAALTAELSKRIEQIGKQRGFWSRFKAWLRS